MLCRKQFLTAFIAIHKKLFSNAKSQFNSAEILPGLRYHKDEAKIVHELFKKGSISEDAYYSLVGRITGKGYWKQAYSHSTTILERSPFSRQR